MTNNDFLYVFLALAVVDLYFSMIQRTAQLISRIGDARNLVGFLVPKFIRFAMPLTFIKWGWVVYWAVAGSTSQALLALFLSWLAAVVLPVPASYTLPAIHKQILVINELDEDLAQHLLEITELWEEHGSRR